jgi:nucleoid-associated protein YgaU
MRKDVKVGLASGAVLVAVAAVYVSSLSKTPTVQRRTGAAAKLTSGSGTSVEIASSTASGTAAAKRTGISIAGTDDAVARSAAPGLAPQTPTADAIRPGADADESVAAATGAEPDWNKLLNQGPLPSLMNHTGGNGTPTAGVTPGRTDTGSSADSTAGTRTDVFAETTANSSTTAGRSIADAPSLSATTYAGSNTASTLMIDSSASSTGGADSGRASATVTGSAGGTHVVKTGESFYTIARDVYGNSHYYPHILRANPNVNPNRLKPGMTIKLPPPSSVKPAESAGATGTGSTSVASDNLLSLSATSGGPLRKSKNPPAASPLAAGEYRVLQDENLYRIAVKLYGSPKKMQEIYELNKGVIGADPAKLKVGTVLKMPAGAR